MNICSKTLVAGALFAGLQGTVHAVTINLPVPDASASNVLFTSIGGGLVSIDFSGFFDFSSVGGSASEAYGGSFTFDTATPPTIIDLSDPNNEIAHYSNPFPSETFDIFGSSFSPIGWSLLLQNGEGVINDFLTFQVSLAVTSGPGIPIPGSGREVWAMGLNASAFPPDMLTSIDFPTDLDVFASATGAPNQFAALVDLLTVDEPSTLTLLAFLVAFVSVRGRSSFLLAWQQYWRRPVVSPTV